MERMSVGNLSCNEFSSTVIFTFNNMQVLRGYSADDGQLSWESRVEGLHFSDITEIDEGGRRGLNYAIPESNIMDRIMPSVSLKDEYEILQVDRRILPEQGSFERDSEVLTFLLNSSNGKGTLLSFDFPRVLHISNHLIASISEDFIYSQIHQFDILRY